MAVYARRKAMVRRNAVLSKRQGVSMFMLPPALYEIIATAVTTMIRRGAKAMPKSDPIQREGYSLGGAMRRSDPTRSAQREPNVARHKN